MAKTLQDVMGPNLDGGTLVSAAVAEIEQLRKQNGEMQQLVTDLTDLVVGDFPTDLEFSDVQSGLRLLLEQRKEAMNFLRIAHKALVFYADPQTYGVNGGNINRIYSDYGKTARETLEMLRRTFWL